MGIAEMVENTTVSQGVDWLKWLPVIINACTLIFNILFYVRVKDYLSFKYTRIEDLAKISAEFLAYLSEIVSADDFEGVPTKIKNYSEQILLCFKVDEKEISSILEEIFQEAKRRKELEKEEDIKDWKKDFRTKTTELQRVLRQHCGVIK